MMFIKKISLYVICLLSLSYLSGCSSWPDSVKQFPASLAGINIADLEQARSSGVERLFSATYDETFDRMVAKVHANKLTIYQENRRDGYIIVINFKKQVNTTRVGIFLEAVSDTETKVTLSSLSATALKKAENVFFY